MSDYKTFVRNQNTIISVQKSCAVTGDIGLKLKHEQLKICISLVVVRPGILNHRAAATVSFPGNAFKVSVNGILH